MTNTTQPKGVLTDEQITQAWLQLDGLSIINGVPSQEWDKVTRLAFARAIESPVSQAYEARISELKEQLKIAIEQADAASRIVANDWHEIKRLKSTIESQSKPEVSAQDVRRLAQRYLDARDREIAALNTAENAQANFGNPKPELEAYEVACRVASDAERVLRRALSNAEPKGDE